MSDKHGIRIHPGILSGTPCLEGTRIPVYLVAEMVWADGVASAQETWDLTREQVLVACWFAGSYGTLHLWAEPEKEDDPWSSPDAYRPNPVCPEWLERWRPWAQAAAGALWRGDFAGVSDPPSDARVTPISDEDVVHAPISRQSIPPLDWNI